jgi:hypothetical protein
MVMLSNPSKIDLDNIARPTVDELLDEDHQAYEAFIKDREDNKRRKAKEDEDAR